MVPDESEPAPPVRPGPVDRAEAVLAAARAELLRPRPRECLLCFLARLVEEVGCDSTLRLAVAYRDDVAPRATALEERLCADGGFCDCEVLMNGWPTGHRVRPAGDDEGLLDEGVDAPAGSPGRFPACRGVRRGSTRACEAWRGQQPRW